MASPRSLYATLSGSVGPAPSAGGGGGNFAARVADAGVVWFHGFSSAAEVDQFRWTNGYGSGNDPLSKGTDAGLVSWQSSGGPEGGGFLRLTYPLGRAPNTCYWWRPFNALTGATNGRGSNDPGAGGTITPAAFNVSDGSSTMISWGGSASNPGWYGSPTDQAANPTKYQGNDFYLQVRVRRAGTPGAPPDAPPYTSITGKSVWITTTNASYTTQELVTYGQSAGGGDVVGTRSRHLVYDGQNFGPLGDGYQPNESTTLSNWTLGWRYSGGWDTLLYHVTPGPAGGTGANRTRFEVWAQHDPALYPAEAGQYTKIWDTLFSQSYEAGSNSVGAPFYPGWNGLLLAIYHNGSVFTTSAFDFDYGQLIFSKSPIAAPTV